jgi:peptidoglycan/xylan/chitin deacetylase (PgdA/CDA1 family)
MRPTAGGLKRMALRGAGSPRFRRTLAHAAAKLDRALILVYHRVGNDHSLGTELVPRVQASTLRSHLGVLRELGDIVPLAEMLDGPRRLERPRFALTFDDDYTSHATDVLPALCSLGVHATFFLSGRGPLGLGPHWFELLESAIDEEGLSALASRLNVTSATIERLASACERDPERQQLLRLTSTPRAQPLDASGIGSLSRAGMTIGFHTRDHLVLTDLDDASVLRAVTDGRSDLERIVGSPIELLAYPHGKADGRVARLVGSAGYRAGFTGMPDPIRRGSDPYLLGRWEPGDVDDTDTFAGLVLRRLLQPAEIAWSVRLR